MIQIVSTDADQPHHLRITSGGPGPDGNASTLVFGENLLDRGSAVEELVAVAREFGFSDPNVYTEGEYFVLRDGRDVKAQIYFINEKDPS